VLFYVFLGGGCTGCCFLLLVSLCWFFGVVYLFWLLFCVFGFVCCLFGFWVFAELSGLVVFVFFWGLFFVGAIGVVCLFEFVRVFLLSFR